MSLEEFEPLTIRRVKDIYRDDVFPAEDSPLLDILMAIGISSNVSRRGNAIVK